MRVAHGFLARAPSRGAQHGELMGILSTGKPIAATLHCTLPILFPHLHITPKSGLSL